MEVHRQSPDAETLRIGMLMGRGLIQQAHKVPTQQAADRVEFGIRDLTVDGKVDLDREVIRQLD
jgi:hypothetical protein